MATSRVLAVMVAMGAGAGVATADTKPTVWLGVVQPVPADVTPCGCATVDAIAHGGSVLVLPPASGAVPADGTQVLVVQPLLGLSVRGQVDKLRVALPGFMLDRRANDDGVLVIAGDVHPVFVAPGAAEIVAIRAVVGHAESLEGVKKALAKLEIGAVDLDGDGKADVASTYGCKVWGEGVCQVPGQFFLVRRADKWVQLE